MSVPYLFVDVVSFERLAAQPENHAGGRGVLLPGYEAYIIEQWACERRASIVASSFTGNQKNQVEVSLLYVPENPQEWGPVTFSHFEELVRMHMLVKETSLGRMLVTNISSLPSHLKLVPIPVASFIEGKRWFTVNEGLRRLSALGRTSVTAVPPSDTVVANFKQLFRIDVNVPPEFAVRELALLLQISLFYFGLMPPQYVDGLICDYTMRALTQWWQTVGKPRFGRGPAPTDKTYMVTSVAALIGSVIGCRQRLRALNYRPPKDPFDAEQFVLAIQRFQKSERLPRTFRLDDSTFWRLIHLTVKMNSDNGDILKVMKSTVKEGLSGKTTNATDDWETLSIDVLAANVRGQRAQYLWKNKDSPGSRPSGAPGAANDEGVPRYAPITGLPTSSLVDQVDGTSTHQHHRPHNSLVGRMIRRAPQSRSAAESTTSLNANPSLGAPFESTKRPTSHSRTNSDWFLTALDRRTSDSPQKDQDKHSLKPDANPPQESPDREKNEAQDHMEQRWDAYLAPRDDSQIPTKPTSLLSDQARHGRSHSLSEIDRIVFPWTTLSPLPKVLALYDEARRLREQLARKMELEAERCDALSGRIVTQDQKLDAENRSHALIRFQVHASMRKEHAVRRRLRELEAFQARLDYEWKSLEGKLRDVEQSVTTFNAKVADLEQRYARSTAGRRAWLPTILGF